MPRPERARVPAYVGGGWERLLFSRSRRMPERESIEYRPDRLVVALGRAFS